jgi:molybdopterin-binding protein
VNIVKISARNVLKGTVVKVIRGAVNSEVVIRLEGGTEIVSIITNESVQNLELKENKEAFAVIKASDVMVAVSHTSKGT